MSAPDDDTCDAARRPSVLVVEDEPQLVRFLRATLSAHGHACLEATTCGEAFTEAATRLPDRILLDLGLPLDGVEVTRRLREWPTTPVIVISARGQEGDKIRALDAGADDDLTTPFGVVKLLARMRVALSNAARAATGAGAPVFRCGGVGYRLRAE